MEAVSGPKTALDHVFSTLAPPFLRRQSGLWRKLFSAPQPRRFATAAMRKALAFIAHRCRTGGTHSSRTVGTTVAGLA